MDEVDEKLEVVEKRSVVWTLDAVALNLLGSEVKVYGKPLRLCVWVCVCVCGGCRLGLISSSSSSISIQASALAG